MNLEEKKVTGLSQINITDALNSALLELIIRRNSMTYTMPSNIIIYVDKQDKNNPSNERREYIFPLKDQIRYLYLSVTKAVSDVFTLKFDMKDNDIVMKAYVERNISDSDESGERHILSTPIIEETLNIPIVLFEGENYIYTNYDVDGMDMELTYATNTENNKKIVNVGMFYGHKINCLNEYYFDDVYYKDAFTKTEDKLNLDVDNAKVACITSKNNKFSLDEEGNLTVNSIISNDPEENNFDILSVYPVGSIYMSVNSSNPATLFGGMWERIVGRFLLGAVDGNVTYGLGKVGGEEEHTLTIDEMPAHNHAYSKVSGSASYKDTASGGAWGDYNAQTDSTGGSKAHNNMPPFLAVYIWKRIS